MGNLAWAWCPLVARPATNLSVSVSARPVGGPRRRRARVGVTTPSASLDPAPLQDDNAADAGYSTPDPNPGPLTPTTLVAEPADLKQEMARSYMEYAMSVILGRALPDVRDGLKPVHRRILFAMHDLNLQSDGPFRKCARVVGEVLGKYHPHGDTAVYDALVRMSQDFSMRERLVDGHGNFGSVDGDPPAAMRYTECRLTTHSQNNLLADIEMNTVDFTPNFDSSQNEPVVLPARLPNLLLNGSSGIAVGMATNIPPHNLLEVLAALTAIIENPDIPDDELRRIIPGPDFPTGGLIMGTKGCADTFSTGRGSIVMRANTHFETLKRSGKRSEKNAIIATELPYQVNKSQLIAKMAELVNEKKLEGISDLRDESDRDGIRIVVELKSSATPEIVQNNLFKKTALQSSFGANVLALTQSRLPKRLSTRECLEHFLEFRRETIRKRTTFSLNRAEDRAHLVVGFLTAQRNMDQVIKMIRASDDSVAARRALETNFGLSSKQSESILGMPLRRLTGLERAKLEDEAKDLESRISNFKEILDQGIRVDNIITEELVAISETNKNAKRRSIFVQDDAGHLDDINLVPNDSSVVTITKQGYMKRMPTSDFDAQKRGTRGKAGLSMLREDDSIQHFFSCMDHDTILVVSDRGVAYPIQAFRVPLGSRTSRGTALVRLLPELPSNHTIASILPVSAFPSDEYLVLLTSKGFIKKTPLAAFSNINIRGLIAIKVDSTDSLKWSRICRDGDRIIIGSRYAKAICFESGSIRPTGRNSKGVMTMMLAEHDRIIDMDIFSQNEDPFCLIISTAGQGKRVKSSAFNPKGRRGKGLIATKFKKECNECTIASLQVCGPNDEVMLITSNGTVVRQSVSNIPIQARTATGVLVQKLDDEDSVAGVTIIPEMI